MANIGKFLATKILNVTARGEQFVFPEKLYVALYTSNPTWNDTGQEVSGAHTPGRKFYLMHRLRPL
ncbi:hypothetical protein P9222_09150 [Paenibacillus amylolyticus]|nr:hypothetical protein [Paenibacillus amylolyticus]WFR64315.1 hypothetical protein P9222_09150 [Paenibacillus amylolyticus]